MRDAVARAITEAARTRDDVLLVVADISPAASLKTFLDENPTRIVDVGVSEQAMIGMAAGLAMTGLRPFAYTIAPFALYRPLEQIRVDLAYQDLPVVVIGAGGGPPHHVTLPHDCDPSKQQCPTTSTPRPPVSQLQTCDTRVFATHTWLHARPRR